MAYGDNDILRHAMDNLDIAADTLVSEFKRLDRVVELSKGQEYPPVHLLNRINIRLRGVLERSEKALEEIERSRPKALEAAE